MSHRILRLLCLLSLVFGMSTPAAYARAAKDASVDAIIICTPSGPKLIAWDFDGEGSPPAQADALCPLCIIAAELVEPDAGPAPSGLHHYAPYSVRMALLRAPLAQAAPYPARAPPV